MNKQLLLKNSHDAYGLVAICLHWVVAVGFIANYLIVYYQLWFLVPRSPEARTVMSYHYAIGLSIIVFVALRIVWKCINRQPNDVPGKPVEHIAAHAMHLLLYMVMVVLPLTGYMGHGRPAKLFFLIEIPRFADTWIFKTIIEGWMGVSWKQFEPPMDFIHKEGGAYIVPLLILAHVGAALYHHYVRKDAVLKRMLPMRPK